MPPHCFQCCRTHHNEHKHSMLPCLPATTLTHHHHHHHHSSPPPQPPPQPPPHPPPPLTPTHHHHHNHHRDTTELQLISTTGDSPGHVKQRIASHPLVDINDVIFEAADRQPGAVALDYHKPVWRFAQQEDQQEWQRLEAWRPGEVAQPVSRSHDKKVSLRPWLCCMAGLHQGGRDGVVTQLLWANFTRVCSARCYRSRRYP